MKNITLVCWLMLAAVVAKAQAPFQPEPKDIELWKDRKFLFILMEEDQKAVKKLIKKDSEKAEAHKTAVSNFNEQIQKIFTDNWKFNEEKEFLTAKQAKPKLKKSGKNYLVFWVYQNIPAEADEKKNPFSIPMMAISRGENFDEEKPEMSFYLPYSETVDYNSSLFNGDFNELHVRFMCNYFQNCFKLLENNKKKQPLNKLIKDDANKNCPNLKNVIVLFDNSCIDESKVNEKVFASTLTTVKYKQSDYEEIRSAAEQGSESYAYPVILPYDVKKGFKGETVEFTLQVVRMVVDCKSSQAMYYFLNQPGGKNGFPEFGESDFRAMSACVKP